MVVHPEWLSEVQERLLEAASAPVFVLEEAGHEGACVAEAPKMFLSPKGPWGRGFQPLGSYPYEMADMLKGPKPPNN